MIVYYRHSRQSPDSAVEGNFFWNNTKKYLGKPPEVKSPPINRGALNM